MNKFETAKKKREFALSMLKQGKGNEAIKEAIQTKFGSSIGSGALSDLRASLGTSGKNRRRPLPVNAAQQTLALVPTTPEVWVPNNQTSPRLHGTLHALLQTMHQENVKSLAIDADGTVKLHVIQEFLLGAQQ